MRPVICLAAHSMTHGWTPHVPASKVMKVMSRQTYRGIVLGHWHLGRSKPCLLMTLHVKRCDFYGFTPPAFVASDRLSWQSLRQFSLFGFSVCATNLTEESATA